MSTMVTAGRVISATLHGDSMEIRGPYSETMQDFYGALPAAKWNRARGCWCCDATPAACWRVTSQAPCRVEADDEITRIGHTFYEPVLRPSRIEPAIARTAPRRHQIDAYSFAFPREATLLDMWMGLGKSLVAVQLAENWHCRRVIVLCPVAVRGVWRREFAKHAVQGWNVLVLDAGTTQKKTLAASRFLEISEAQNVPCAVVVNYDTAKLEPFAKWSLGIEWDLAVADESHRMKGHASAIGKYCASLARVAKRRLALSGTPMSHSPLDLFGQFRFLDRGIFGTSWHRFRNAFAVSGPFGADHIVGFKNQDELAQRMSLITFRAGAENLDLPEATHIEIPVALEKETRRLLDEMADDLIAFLDGGGEITAANGLVKLLRLMQIAGGFCKRDDGVEISVGFEKRNALVDLLADLAEPVVVFCQFRHDLDTIREATESLNRRYGEVSGARKDLTPEALMPENVDVLGVQTAAGGVGVDLTRARVAIYYSPGFSLGNHEQSLARVHRPGQTRPVVYYYLVGTDSADQVVYGALRKKRNVIDAVLGYLKGEPTDVD